MNKRIIRNYIICIAVTVAMMATALAVPSLFIPDLQGNAINHPNNYTPDDDSLSYWEKIYAVGLYIAKTEGYEKNQIDKDIDDSDRASSQFFSIIEKMHLDKMITDDLYNDLATTDCHQSVTDYEYLLDSDRLLVVRVVDRTYYSVTTADSISLSVGFDRDSGQIIYFYLNFFGDLNMDTTESINEDFINKCAQRWSALIGIFGNSDLKLENELDEENKQRFLAEYHVNGSVILQYQIGLSYDESNDRYQFFVSPKAS